MQAYLTLLDLQDVEHAQRREALFVDARDIVQLSKKDSTPDYATSEAKLQKVSLSVCLCAEAATEATVRSAWL